MWKGQQDISDLEGRRKHKAKYAQVMAGKENIGRIMARSWKFLLQHIVTFSGKLAAFRLCDQGGAYSWLLLPPSGHMGHEKNTFDKS